MRIFELLDQYEGICRRFFFGCSAKLNKTFKANIIEILILIMGRTPKDKLSSARTLRMVQTLNASELKAKSMTFSEWYLPVLKRHRDNLLKITPLLVADAAFSNLPFYKDSYCRVSAVNNRVIVDNNPAITRFLPTIMPQSKVNKRKVN